MRKRTNIGLVLCGYALACLGSTGIVWVYQRLTQDAAAQASAGMYAFGDLFLGLCGGLASLPTLLGVYFLLKK